MRRLLLLFVALLAAVSFAAGCGSSSTTKSNTGTVRMSMTDSPADFDSVILIVREVAVHREGPDGTGWTSFTPDSSRYDLLLLRNGVFAGLGEALVDAGHYTQVRLLLDPGSYVVENGVRRDIVIPSGDQTGYKLVGEWDVPAGGTVDLGLDFDAARSFHETGSGKLMLKPTCKVYVINATGAISGAVTPSDSTSIAYAISGPDTIGSAITDATGMFKLSLLPPGSYSVAIDAPVSFRDTTILGVGVTAGQTTSIGTVNLQAK